MRVLQKRFALFHLRDNNVHFNPTPLCMDDDLVHGIHSPIISSDPVGAHLALRSVVSHPSQLKQNDQLRVRLPDSGQPDPPGSLDCHCRRGYPEHPPQDFIEKPHDPWKKWHKLQQTHKQNTSNINFSRSRLSFTCEGLKDV